MLPSLQLNPFQADLGEIWISIYSTADESGDVAIDCHINRIFMLGFESLEATMTQTVQGKTQENVTSYNPMPRGF